MDAEDQEYEFMKDLNDLSNKMLLVLEALTPEHPDPTVNKYSVMSNVLCACLLKIGGLGNKDLENRKKFVQSICSALTKNFEALE